MRKWILLLLAAIGLAGCAGGETTTPTLEPRTLLTDAATKIRASDTFRLYVLQEGAPYDFLIAVDENATEAMTVQFRLAEGQYVAPDELQATASVRVGGLGATIEIEIYADGEDQWFRVPTLAIPWQNRPFAPGFDPIALIGEDTGFEAALSSLVELEFVGNVSLEDGQPVYHLRGIADGAKVGALVVGLLDIQGSVPVDVYINRDNMLPVRLVVTQPETASERYPDPTRWIIDVFDINADPALQPPQPS